ncbi:MAG TPA: hypothetical protein VNW06_11285 [Cytophagaceae bacterium]|jgi:hypothetical protein|nr:hypothetical protein [Cytophagaceae bacterium]
MPFDEEDDVEIKQKVTIKPSGKESVFDKMPKKITKQEFEQKAAEANAKLNSYSERALENTMAFKKLMEDRTVPQNKSVFSGDLEKEVISNLMNLAIDMNEDPHEKEGMGSVGLIVFLFRLLLSQKDRVNELDYKVHTLEKKLGQAEVHIKNLQTLSANIDTKNK